MVQMFPGKYLACAVMVCLTTLSLQQQEEQISRRVDLAFLIDESGSISAGDLEGNNWMKILNFVISIIVGNPVYATQGLPIHPNEARVGVVTFADMGTMRWDLNQYTNKAELVAAIQSLTHTGGGTNTTGGFRVTKEQVFTPSGGDRPGVNDVIVLVTDGQPSREIHQLDDYVRRLREEYNFRVIGIGVTDAVNRETISRLVSPPPQQNYFNVDTFNNFSSIEDALYNRIINSTNTFLRDQGEHDDRTKVNKIMPTYGPIAGGTRLTVQGEYLYLMEQPTLVYLYQGEEYQLCGTATSINEELICDTVPLLDGLGVIIGIPQRVIIKWLDSSRVSFTTSYTFTYKNNPRIENIQPLQTIVSGGVELTIQGDDMDASPSPTIYYDVAVPILYYNYTNSQVCTIVDQHSIRCLTTEISLPDNKQLSTGDDCSLDGESLCQHELDVYIGVEFDNYKEYRDLRNRDDGLDEFNKILVFPDPVVHYSDGEGTLRSWWPHSLHKVTAEGEDLNLDQALLNFTIGDKKCRELEIYEREVICVPQNNKPSGKGEDEKFAVQLRIGKLEFDVTRVGFETSIWDCKDCRVGLNFGIACVGIVIFAVVFLIARRATKSCREDA